MVKTDREMNACGIIAEYNPFHRGHAYQIEKTRELTGCDVVVAVMSGNWVQRGEPAIIDKWMRAETAVKHGVDLVLELPFPYAVQAASGFARGGVKILQNAGVSSLSFGSECGNLENLQEIADSPVSPDHLRQSMAEGISFPRAYSLLTREMGPNDILATAYLKELKNTSVRPVVLQRTSAYNDTELKDVASALAIRKALQEHRDIGNTAFEKELLEHSFHNYLSLYYPYLRIFLTMTNRDTLCQYFLVSEGIEKLLIQQAELNDTFEGFLSGCVNARYTRSRIQRTLVHILCQVTKQEIQELPEYDVLRVLAFNDQGRQYLEQLKKKEVKIVSKYARNPLSWRNIELRSTHLYTSVMPEEKRVYLNKREIQGPVFVR